MARRMKRVALCTVALLAIALPTQAQAATNAAGAVCKTVGAKSTDAKKVALTCTKVGNKFVWKAAAKAPAKAAKAPSTPTLSGYTIKIGVLTDLTGSSATVGRYDRRWAELMQDRQNAAGGILGHPVKVYVYDTGLDPTKAASAARKAIEQDGVVALSCCISSSESLQVAVVAKQYGVPLLGGSIIGPLTDKDLPSYGTYFRVLPGEEATATANINYAVKKGWKTIGISRSTLAYGTSGLATLTALAKDAKIEIIENVALTSTTTEASAQAAVLIRANPDAVFTWDYPVPTAAMAAALKQGGYKGAFLSNWSALNDTFWAMVGTDLNNTFAHDGYTNLNPRSQTVIDEFEARYDDRHFSIHQLMTSAFIDTAYAGVEASMKKLAPGAELTGEKVTKGILSLTCHKTTFGTEASCLKFGRAYVSASGVNPYQGGTPEMITMKTVEKGKWVAVK